jgi:hypothetical protein
MGVVRFDVCEILDGGPCGVLQQDVGIKRFSGEGPRAGACRFSFSGP